jgi:hypothetical protein
MVHPLHLAFVVRGLAQAPSYDLHISWEVGLKEAWRRRGRGEVDDVQGKRQRRAITPPTQIRNMRGAIPGGVDAGSPFLPSSPIDLIILSTHQLQARAAASRRPLPMLLRREFRGSVRELAALLALAPRIEPSVYLSPAWIFIVTCHITSHKQAYQSASSLRLNRWAPNDMGSALQSPSPTSDSRWS